MTREFLLGLELDKETIDTIMAEHGKVTQGLREQLQDSKNQLENANNEIKSYKDMDVEGIKTKSAEWEAKYNQIVEDQKKAEEKRVRDERTNEFFKDTKFASESAKAGVLAQFNEKDFKYDEASKKYQGASEWLEELKTNDSGAFLSEVANPKFTTTPNTSNVNVQDLNNQGVKLNSKIFKNYN